MQTFSQNNKTDRLPIAAGRFYRADKEILIKELSELFSTCRKPEMNRSVRAIVSPHAGFIFSGRTAASAYSSIPKNHSYKNIFIIGSSHVMSFEGASVYSEGDFITPLGRLKVNTDIAEALIGENTVFKFPATSHIREHSIEVQLPFIQYYLGEKSVIVPIIIGTENKDKLKDIAKALSKYFVKDNLFIISSDFSHYPSYDDALKIDMATSKSFISGDPEEFLKELIKNSNYKTPGLLTSMCGWTSGLTLLYLAQGKDDLEFKQIDYSNSGDSDAGSKTEVVGYDAIALFEKNAEFTLNEKEEELLFSIARNSIITMLNENRKVEYVEKGIPDKLKLPGGAFVTLKLNGSLRGCIGRFISSDPLFEVVQLSALSSAFEDPRFTPITKKEFEKTELEITVLGPLKRIFDINEIVLGRTGIYIKKDFKTGTMLPQVAIENNWSIEQFLGYTSRDKAGIGWDGWKDAEIYIYEGLVLKENH